MVKNLLKISAFALAAVGVTPLAFADTALATVSKVTGEDGTVVVIRQTDAFALREGDDLFDGDRIIVRPQSVVEIAGIDCTVSLEESQSLTVSSNLCEDAIALVSPGEFAGVSSTVEAVGTAAPLWTLFAATAGPTAAAVDALTGANGASEDTPIVAESPTQSTSP